MSGAWYERRTTRSASTPPVVLTTTTWMGSQMATKPLKAELTAAQARALFSYNPQTGKLVLLNRPRELFPSDKEWKRWNSRSSGTEAGAVKRSSGYRMVCVFGREYRAHRIIWLMQTGEWPESDIDHINGVRHDNRLANLRAVSHATNLRNQSRNSRNTSGFAGVSWHKGAEKWSAQIKVNGKKVHLGLFATAECAAQARAAANSAYGFSERHGVAA